MRYFIEIAYKGTPYHGWQRQPNAMTVQEELEKALTTLLKTKIDLIGAGRTDAGVHARQLFAHFDYDKNLDRKNCGKLHHRLNRFLTPYISVNAVFQVSSYAHARFDAISRSYEYWLTPKKDPFAIEHAYLVERQLDYKAMNEAAKLLIGKQNFKCFSRSNTDVKTYICEVTMAVWEPVGDKYVFRISANRFLRNMVRAIVGTLLDIGQHKILVSAMRGILAEGDRSLAGASVPAHGLYLTAVHYPDSIYLNNG